LSVAISISWRWSNFIRFHGPTDVGRVSDVDIRRECVLSTGETDCVAMAGPCALLGVNSGAREQRTPVIVIANTFLSLGRSASQRQTSIDPYVSFCLFCHFLSEHGTCWRELLAFKRGESLLAVTHTAPACHCWRSRRFTPA
jgi:hypothetical protein